MILYVKNKIGSIYEKHDEKPFTSKISDWNNDLLGIETNNLIKNFSKERVENIKKIISHIEGEKKIENISSSYVPPKQNYDSPRSNSTLNTRVSKDTSSASNNYSTRGFKQNNSNREKFEKNKKKTLSNLSNEAKLGIGLIVIGGIIFVIGLSGGIFKILLGIGLVTAGTILFFNKK